MVIWLICRLDWNGQWFWVLSTANPSPLVRPASDSLTGITTRGIHFLLSPPFVVADRPSMGHIFCSKIARNAGLIAQMPGRAAAFRRLINIYSALLPSPLIVIIRRTY